MRRFRPYRRPQCCYRINVYRGEGGSSSFSSRLRRTGRADRFFSAYAELVFPLMLSLSKHALVCAVENLRKPFIRFPLGLFSAHAELVEACIYPSIIFVKTTGDRRFLLKLRGTSRMRTRERSSTSSERADGGKA